jgi:hypothetical protein
MFVTSCSSCVCVCVRVRACACVCVRVCACVCVRACVCFPPHARVPTQHPCGCGSSVAGNVHPGPHSTRDHLPSVVRALCLLPVCVSPGHASMGASRAGVAPSLANPLFRAGVAPSLAIPLFRAGVAPSLAIPLFRAGVAPSLANPLKPLQREPHGTHCLAEVAVPLCRCRVELTGGAVTSVFVVVSVVALS